jgi:hypothetical protein
MMNIQDTDREAGAVAVAPRVTLADLEAKIGAVYHTDGRIAVGQNAAVSDSEKVTLSLLSICIIVMRNGFTIIGKSAPASAANFNMELGRKLAYDDALKQAWAFEGYVLREKLIGFPPLETDEGAGPCTVGQSHHE